MIALPMAPEGSWNDQYTYEICSQPPGELVGHPMVHAKPVMGWSQVYFKGGAPSRLYVRLYHAKSGELRWLKLLAKVTR